LAFTLPGSVSKDFTSDNLGILFSLSNFVSYDALSPSFKHLCLFISSDVEP
jgi:hypothetical protein